MLRACYIGPSVRLRFQGLATNNHYRYSIPGERGIEKNGVHLSAILSSITTPTPPQSQRENMLNTRVHTRNHYNHLNSLCYFQGCATHNHWYLSHEKGDWMSQVSKRGVHVCACVRISRLSSHKSYARVTQNVVQKGYALHHVNRLSCQHLPVAPYLLPGLELSMLSGSPIWRENTTFKFWHNNNTTTLQWVRYELWI